MRERSIAQATNVTAFLSCAPSLGRCDFYNRSRSLRNMAFMQRYVHSDWQHGICSCTRCWTKTKNSVISIWLLFAALSLCICSFSSVGLCECACLYDTFANWPFLSNPSITESIHTAWRSFRNFNDCDVLQPYWRQLADLDNSYRWLKVTAKIHFA